MAMTLWAAGALPGVGVLTAGAAQAQDFPSRPIRFVVPFPPGPAGDLTARYYAKRLQELVGQPVIVDNRPGGNGFIGVQAALSQPADGYTVFVGSNSPMAANAALFRKLPYDPVGDFAPLHGLMRAPMVIVVSAQSPYRTLEELVSAARASGRKMNYSAGTAAYQLMIEHFAHQAGISAVHVPYKGGMEAVRGVLGGETDFTVIDVTAPLPLIRAGRLRALAVATEQRIPALPDVPTTAEAGLKDYVVYVWVAAFVRADTPRPLQERLSQLLARIVESPETREYYAAQNAEPMTAGPQALRRYQEREVDLWKRVARSAGIEPE
jgi:tripartite-type tricarboxylate transporter receptor subunit TctC